MTKPPSSGISPEQVRAVLETLQAAALSHQIQFIAYLVGNTSGINPDLVATIARMASAKLRANQKPN